MIIKYSAIIFLICGLIFSFKTVEKRQHSIEKTIIKVVKAFKEKDTTTLNSLILKEKGLIVLFRRGVFDEYTKTSKIDFDSPVPEYLPYFDFFTDYELKFDILPTYDCDLFEWNKHGIYCDTLHINKLLSTTAINLKEDREDNIPESEIYSFKELEKKSKRIVLSDSSGGELVFYLTLIDDKWYLTIIDRLTSDCSA